MSELRKDPVTRRWVIIATERAKRPSDFVKPKPDSSAIPEYLDKCPFCEGNENQTPQSLCPTDMLALKKILRVGG